MPVKRLPSKRDSSRQVFINCPFTLDYQEKFRSIVFTIIRSGFEPRCALEADDSAENRFNKICAIIQQCRLGVHDISKTEPDSGSGLPRLNMTLELGLFLAAKKFGIGENKKKRCMILDSKQYRYQKFMSDIAGQDIHSHGNTTAQLIEKIASWLREEVADPKVPGGKAIMAEFKTFSKAVPHICKTKQLHVNELTFQDFRKMAETWMVATASIALSR